MIPLPATRAVLSGRQTYAQKVLTIAPANLLAYWQLKETSGTAIVDSSPNARHGVYTGVDLAQSQPPFVCPLWDGVNDYGNVYSAALAGAFNGAEGTVALWFKVASAGVWSDATNRYVLAWQVDANNRVLILKTATANQLRFQYTAGGTIEQVNTTLSATGWLLIALTWSKAAEEVKAYVSGVQVGTTQAALGVWAGTLASTTVLLGALSSVPASVWSGYLAHPVVWNVALSPAQIATLATP